MSTNSVSEKIIVDDKATIYTTSEMMGNVTKIEVVELRFWRAPFAQYSSAVHVEWRGPRKRKFSHCAKGYSPFFLILKGWNHPDPPSFLVRNPLDSSISTSRYFSFDERWRTTFNSAMKPYLAERPDIIIADTRDSSD